MSNNSNGIGFFGALTILFIGLKLGGVINWSWWWILSPLWIPISVVILVTVIIIIIMYIKDIL